MESAENIALKMNEMLEADSFSRKDFDILLNRLKEVHSIKVIILDFKYYSEKLLRKIKKEKIKFIKVQDFEKAAKLRDIEKECLGYISIRKEYKIEKSAFYLDQEYLFYLCLGTARNDQKVEAYFRRSV
jgi:hypothetical protein